MFCPKCALQVREGETFCRVCGAKLTNGIPGMPNQNQIPNGMNNMANISDEELYDVFIGKNALAFRKGGFSWCTLFFGVAYCLYRKMWLIGILWFVVNLIVQVLLPSISGLVVIATNIFFSIKFKKLYMKNVRDSVAKIKTQNRGKSYHEIKVICSKKGGTSILTLVIILVLNSVVTFAITLPAVTELMAETKEPSGIVDENDDDNDDSENDAPIEDERGVLYDLSTVIPENFEVSDQNSSTYKNYSYLVNPEYCYISMRTVSVGYYISAKDYLEKSISVLEDDTLSPYTNKNINSSTWTNVTVNKSTGAQYDYYAIIHEDKIYKVDFYLSGGNTTCIDAKTNIINSLEIK